MNDVIPMTEERVQELRERFIDDDNIDCSDIPELDDSLLAKARVVNYAEKLNTKVIQV